VNQLVLTGLASMTAALLALGVAAIAGPRWVAAPGSLVLCGGGALLTLIGLIGGAVPAALALPLGPPGAVTILGFDGLSGFFLLVTLFCGGCVAIAGNAPSLPPLLGAMALTLLAADAFTLAAGLLLTALVPSFVSIATDRRAGASGPSAALLTSIAPKLVLYVLIRVLFDGVGPLQSPWWGAALMVLGVAGAASMALRANLAGDLRSILLYATSTNTGLVAVALGAALAARSADLAPLASMALGAALLLVLAHALFNSLLVLGVVAVEESAGSRRLDRLGGLIHGMPATTACVLAGAAAMAGLPATAGFAAQWELFQALFGAPRTGGMALQMLVIGAVAALALTTALSAAAALRFVGIAFLGRPRSPRGAASTEAPREMRFAMTGLAVATVLVGLLPGVALALAAPALRALVGAGHAHRAGLFTLAAQTGSGGYSAPATATLMAIAGMIAMAFVRVGAETGTRGVPAWECGNEPPPPWLPFGDPLTQYGGGSLSRPLRQIFASVLPTLESDGIVRAADWLLHFPQRFRVASTPRAMGTIALVVVAALAVTALMAR
jgi:hypothetical protein